MYQGKHSAPKKGGGKKYNKSKVTLISVLAFVLVLAIGGTLAWLVTKDDAIVNTFLPSQVSCHVEEEFDGTYKKNVNVVNDSNIAAYLRVKLVTYRVNTNGDHIGGTATIPSFTPGEGWFLKDGYYYYKYPVAAGRSPENALISSIELTGSYSDADGGKQVIEVMAEAIQSVPTSVVAEKWNVTVGTDGTLSKGTTKEAE